METGFIKLYRSLTDWEWYKDTNTMRVWLHLLLTANWKDSRFQGHNIPAGSLVIGRKKLSRTLGLTEQQVRTALEHLKSTNEITIKTTNKFSIVTIEKWRVFQNEEVRCNQLANQVINHQITNKQPTSNQQVTTIEERKKERMEERKNILINDKQELVGIKPIISERLGRKLGML